MKLSDADAIAALLAGKKVRKINWLKGMYYVRKGDYVFTERGRFGHSIPEAIQRLFEWSGSEVELFDESE